MISYLIDKSLTCKYQSIKPYSKYEELSSNRRLNFIHNI